MREGYAQDDAPHVPDRPAPAAAPQHDGALAEENQQLRTQLLRQQVAAQRGLDPALWDRVTGDTPDAIAADCAKLARFSPAAARKRPAALQSGAGAEIYRTPKERAVVALRNLPRGG